MADDDLIAKLPDDRLYAPDQEMWVRLEEDGRVRLGATHLVASHGQFVYFTPRPPGTEVARDRSLGVMETMKTAVAIHAPLSGRVLAVNEAVVADVRRIELDPYGSGWMFLLAPSDLEEERGSLLDRGAYARRLAGAAASGNGPVGEQAHPDFDPLEGM